MILCRQRAELRLALLLGAVRAGLARGVLGHVDERYDPAASKAAAVLRVAEPGNAFFKPANLVGPACLT